MKIVKKYLLWAVVSIVLPITSANCSSSDDNPPVSNETGMRFTIPAKIDITSGGEFTFSVVDAPVPQTSDFFMLEGSNGVLYISPIVSATDDSFTVRFSDKVKSGSYRAYLKHGDRRVTLGQISVDIVKAIVIPEDGATIYGLVSTEEAGIPGVVVSDGYEVTTTDASGVYNLKSNKELGYIFISVPSGYEVEADGVLPRMYRTTFFPAGAVERADFNLTQVSGQDKYKVFFLGDMHLANRTDDASQFKKVMADFNNYRSTFGGKKAYAITLGDMTWDLYWYDNKYQIADYVKTINEQVKGIQIFHTLGNHDHDFKALNDLDATLQYRTHLSPGYYSFNIGNIHYVILDDINCDGYDGTTARLYTKDLTDEQLNWLAKDLAYVNKTTPVIVVAHAPFFRPSSNALGQYVYDHDRTSTDRLLTLLDGYKVHFVTGHTHMNYNVPAKNSISGGRDIMEHNVAAICASWWWSGYLTPGHHLSTDGTPGGYAVWDIDGNNIQWLYKGSDMSENVQFRSYDLNQIRFTSSDVPNLSGSAAGGFDKYMAAYPANSNNEVLINVWNWNPDWSITVTTPSGQNLTCTPTAAYDPLHIAALTVPRYNKANLSSAPSFCTELFTHFFKVKAPDASSTLTITVKDEFGHTWTEEMKRPKAFSTDAYLVK